MIGDIPLGRKFVALLLKELDGLELLLPAGTELVLPDIGILPAGDQLAAVRHGQHLGKSLLEYSLKGQCYEIRAA
jgi:hypothetical protein